MPIISVRINADVTPLEGLEAYLEQFPKKAQEVGREVYEAVRPPLLDELRFYPPVPPGSRYQRTYRLRNNWEVTFEMTPGGFRFGVSNKTWYAAWVVGSLAQNIDAASRFQREFHARHGWPLASATAGFWFDAFVEEFAQAFMADIGKFANTSISRRAVTRVS